MVFRAGVVSRLVPAFLVGLRSALTPVDSCARAHLTTVVLRQLGLRHGPRRWGSVSCLRRSQIVVFDLWLRDSKHSIRLSDIVSENRMRFAPWVSPTPNLTAFRNGQV